MAAQLCEDTKDHWVVHFKMVKMRTFMLGEFSLNEKEKK